MEEEIFRRACGTEKAEAELKHICDLCQSGDINEGVNQLGSFIIDKAVMVFGRKRWKKRRRKKWFNNSCRNFRAEVKFLGVRLHEDPNNCYLRGLLFKAKKQYKKFVKKEKQKYKEALLQKILHLQERDPKLYWKMVSELRKLETKDTDNTLNIDAADWEIYYRQLLNEKKVPEWDAKIIPKLDKLESEKYFSELDFGISKNEVMNAIKSLKNGKAQGLDRLSGELIKGTVNGMADTYRAIFNNILQTGCYPDVWNQGYIVSIHKKGPIDKPFNFRGITINNVMGKIFGIIMNDRLKKFDEKHKIISKSQISTKRGARTTDHIFVFRILFEKYVKRMKKRLYACFVDFQKAFDKVWRVGLFYKLQLMGIKGNFYQVIKSMYRNVETSVKIGNKRTEMFTTNIGVRQGDVMSPLLFNLFINDIPSVTEVDGEMPELAGEIVNCLMYADDLVLLSTSPQKLQEQLDKLHTYCSEWHLEVNIEKTKIIEFNAQGRMGACKYNFGGVNLESVREYQYLGIILTASGSFTPAIENLYRKAQKALFHMKSSLHNSNFDPKVGLKIFDHLIKPILLYGSEVWGALSTGTNAKHMDHWFENRSVETKFEKLHMHFCKYILNVNSKTTNMALYGETGRYPLNINVWKHIIKYLVHLQSSDDGNLIKYAYEEASQYKSDKNTYLGRINEVLYEFDGEIENPNWFAVVDKMRHQFEKKWRTTLDKNEENGFQGNKLRFYRVCKDNFGYEQYLSVVKNPQQRTAIARLRTSAHKLYIEVGRHTKIPVNNRICTHCNMGKIEDELHFIFECPKYVTLRLELLRLCHKDTCHFNNMTRAQQIFYIFNSSTDLLKAFGCFAVTALEVRNA